MQTRLVRLKHPDPKRGLVLKRYTYRGVRFQHERGWYRVSQDVAEHLATVRQVASDPQSPLAFDVMTEEQAQRADVEQAKAARPTLAVDALEVVVPRDELDDASAKKEGRGKRAKPSAPAEPTE